MLLRHARQLAEQLLDQHGLAEKGWAFAWSHAKQTLGSAQIKTLNTQPLTHQKTLKLSKHHARLNPQSHVRETLLHEVAHALTFEQHLQQHQNPAHETPHGPTWKRHCHQLGIPPHRLAGPDVATPEPRYRIDCPRCQQTLARRHRKPNPNRYRQAFCKHCGPQTTGQLAIQTSAEPLTPTSTKQTTHKKPTA